MKTEYKKFDVILVDFGDSVMAGEQAGIRPSVVVQNDTGNMYGDTTLVMPFTTKCKKLCQPTHALIRKGKNKGLVEDSVLLGECLRQVSKKRIMNRLGEISDIEDQNQIRKVYFANWSGRA